MLDCEAAPFCDEALDWGATCCVSCTCGKRSTEELAAGEEEILKAPNCTSN